MSGFPAFERQNFGRGFPGKRRSDAASRPIGYRMHHGAIQMRVPLGGQCRAMAEQIADDRQTAAGVDDVAGEAMPQIAPSRSSWRMKSSQIGANCHEHSRAL
jgi:hypothetical protein